MDRDKRQVLMLCWIGYTVSYLLRTNLSAVLDKLMLEFQITKAMAGSIGSLFFWCYAAGQILAGCLAERVNPKRLAALGLALSALCNAAIGLVNGYMPVLVLWGLNGLLLSLVWTPMFKILTNWFSDEEYRKVSVWISLPTTVGYLMSWGLIRTLAAHMPWRAAFYLPAALTALFLVAWQALLSPAPNIARGGGAQPDAPAPRRNRLPLGQLLFGYGLAFIALAAVVQGLIKEGINLWGPTLLTDIGGQTATGLVSLFSVLIPVCGTLGIFGVNWLVKRLKESSAAALVALFALSAVASAAMCMVRAFVPSVLLLSALMACVCGANVLITVLIPMRFAKHNIAAQVSGALNFLCYAGAGLGGSAFGLASDRWGWQSVYLMWAVLCALSVAAIAISLFTAKRSEPGQSG